MYDLRSIPARSKEYEAKAKLNDWTLKYEYFRQLRGRNTFLPRRNGFFMQGIQSSLVFNGFQNQIS